MEFMRRLSSVTDFGAKIPHVSNQECHTFGKRIVYHQERPYLEPGALQLTKAKTLPYTQL